MPLSHRAALVFGVAGLLTAVLLTLGVFVGLPARWVVVDIAAALLLVLKLASGVSLIAGTRGARTTATIAAGLSLALGLALVTTLALTASWLSGVYGPVGRGAAVLMVLVAAMVLPYLVVLPVVQLVWLRPAAPPASG